MTAVAMDVHTAMDVDQNGPATPEKEERPTESAPAPSSEGDSPDLKTPPKQSQESVGADDADDDSNEAVGLQLYYLLLQALFKELDLYDSRAEGMLDAKKQMLVYHYAAKLFDLRVDALGALHGDFALTANLPSAYQKVTRKLRKKLQEQGQDERLNELTEKHVFGHDHAIRFVESTLPSGAKEHCVWIREKPHAQSDIVKSISPFRDVIKFHCNRNPLMLIEDHSMGLVLSVEKVFPVAYLVVSPFLKKPEVLQKALKASDGHGNKGWQILEEELSEHLMNFVASDSDGWRSFVQRRANIVSKGSLTIIQRVLRLNPSKEGLDATAAQKLQDLQDEVEVLREAAKKAEETAAKILGKENLALEGKVSKIENKNIDLSVIAERMQADGAKLRKELDTKIQEHQILEQRADASEAAVNAQRTHVEDLERRTEQAEEQKRGAEDKMGDETRLRLEAEHSQSQMEEELRGKVGEASLLASGVQEMMIELRQSQARTKSVKDKMWAMNEQHKKTMHEKTEMHSKTMHEKVEHAKALEVELKQVQASEKHAIEHAHAKDAEADQVKAAATEQVKDAKDAATEQVKAAELLASKATEQAAEAKQTETEAVAALQVKEEALERLTESNVAMRAEAAGAADVLAEVERVRNEAVAEADTARQELQGRDDNIVRLQESIEEQQASVVAAKSGEEKAKELQQAAEQQKEDAESKAAEACAKEAQLAATVQIKQAEIETLTASCSAFSVETSKLKEFLETEMQRAEAAEQSLVEVKAQLEIKARTVETMTADSTALRVSLLNAQETAEEAVQKSTKLVAEAEKAATEAADSEKKALTKLKTNLKAIAELEATIDEMKAKPEPSQELLAELASARAEVEDFKKQALEAEKTCTEAHKVEAEASARAAIKTEEAAGLAVECAGLRAESVRLNEETKSATDRADVAEAGERGAKTALQFKTDDVERVCATNVELRTEILDAQQKATEAEKRADAGVAAVEESYRARDMAQAELRGKVLAAESIAAAMGAVRAEADAARAAEEAAIELARKANEQVDAANKKVLAAHKTESQATAKFEVKAKEASQLTSECSTLRGEADLYRQKSEASSRAIKALATSCEALKAELNASEAKHDWSKLQQPVPDFVESDLTLADFEDALAEPTATATEDVAAVGLVLGKRLRSKGPESRLSAAAPAPVEVPVEVEAPPAKRARAKNTEPPAQKKVEPPAQKKAEPPAQKKETRVITADTIPQVGDEVEFQKYQGCKIAEIFADGSIQVLITGLGRMKADPGQWKLKGQVALDAD